MRFFWGGMGRAISIPIAIAILVLGGILLNDEEDEEEGDGGEEGTDGDGAGGEVFIAAHLHGHDVGGGGGGGGGEDEEHAEFDLGKWERDGEGCDEEGESGNLEEGNVENEGATALDAEVAEGVADAEERAGDGQLAEGEEGAVDGVGQWTGKWIEEEADHGGDDERVAGHAEEQDPCIGGGAAGLASLEDKDGEAVIEDHAGPEEDKSEAEGVGLLGIGEVGEAVGEDGDGDIGEVATKGGLDEGPGIALGDLAAAPEEFGEGGNEQGGGKEDKEHAAEGLSGEGGGGEFGDDKGGQGDPVDDPVEGLGERLVEESPAGQRCGEGKDKKDGEDGINSFHEAAFQR